jgi:hypothetical protein
MAEKHSADRQESKANDITLTNLKNLPFIFLKNKKPPPASFPQRRFYFFKVQDLPLQTSALM